MFQVLGSWIIVFFPSVKGDLTVETHDVVGFGYCRFVIEAGFGELCAPDQRRVDQWRLELENSLAQVMEICVAISELWMSLCSTLVFLAGDV